MYLNEASDEHERILSVRKQSVFLLFGDSTLTKGTFSSRLLLSNQDKGCTPSVAHSLPLPLGPALLNLSNVSSVWRFNRVNVNLLYN